LFDCDGVIWRGPESIPGVAESLDKLRKLGKKLYFISNNSSKSRADFKKRFNEKGINVDLSEIYCSVYATAQYLKSIAFSKKAYLVGEAGFADELRLHGIPFSDINEHASIPDNLSQVLEILKPDPNIGAVIVGFDSKLTYPKVAMASLFLRDHPEVLFIGSNPDSTVPTPKGLIPETGANLAMIEYATDRKPLIIGKPNQILMTLIQSQHKINPTRTVMVGDRMDTDITFGNRGGTKTCLVLTGVTTRDEIESLKSSLAELSPEVEESSLPHYVLNSVGDLHSQAFL
jgi:phosphoglycolate/pyridoxal phosphate phosphatase family enzyme